MKIIHITPSYKPAFIYGGTITSVALLCETLASTGTDVEVWTTTANGKTNLPIADEKLKTIEGVPVRYFKRITGDHTHLSPSLLLHAFKNVSSRKNMLVHIHSWWNLTAMLSCIILKIKRVPVVLSPRGMLTTYSFNNRNVRLKSIIHRLIGRYLLNYVAIHATSEQEKQDILKIHQVKIEVIPNLISTPPLNPEEEPAAQNPSLQLLYLGRIEQKKGLENLFKALAQLTFPWTLRIAGTGKSKYISQLQNLISQLHIEANIEWLGQVYGESKYKILSGHDLLVLFSHNENFANAVAESLSVGTAVALSDRVGLSAFVSYHNLGWVSEPTIPGIIRTLTEVRNDHQKRDRIRQTAPSIISREYCRKNMHYQYLSFYLRCI